MARISVNEIAIQRIGCIGARRPIVSDNPVKIYSTWKLLVVDFNHHENLKSLPIHLKFNLGIQELN